MSFKILKQVRDDNWLNKQLNQTSLRLSELQPTHRDMSRLNFPKTVLVILLCILTAAVVANAQSNSQVMDWTVNGQKRQALVYIPSTAKSKPTPVIFAFHGHGGTMQNMYRTRGFDKLWPEAIFICPQGLPTVGQLVDPEGKLPGWGKDADESNPDVAFFDAMLKTLEKDYNVDKSQIYVTGHSNGGGFTYILWALRGDVFAAVAPTSAAALRLKSMLKPKPFFQAMGDNDPLVKPFIQRLTSLDIKKLNQCESQGTSIAQYATLYKSATDNPVIIYDHPGGHEYPLAANQLIIDFFKGQMKK